MLKEDQCEEELHWSVQLGQQTEAILKGSLENGGLDHHRIILQTVLKDREALLSSEGGCHWFALMLVWWLGQQTEPILKGSPKKSVVKPTGPDKKRKDQLW